MQYHPIAEIYPLMDPEEFGHLVADMKKYGYDKGHPVMLYEGKILDGRNRWQSAHHAGVKADTTEFVGDNEEALRFVVRQNSIRRHLTAGQKATAALDIERFFTEFAKAKQKANQYQKTAFGANGTVRADPPTPGSESVQNGSPRSTRANDPTPIRPLPVRALHEAAKITGASRKTTQDVKAIRAASPETYQLIKNGTLSVNAAKRVVGPPPERPKSNPGIARAPEFKVQINALRAVERWVRATADDAVCGRQIARVKGNLLRDIENAVIAIKFATPAISCPCRGQEPDCRICHGDGWITEGQHERLPAKSK